MLKSFWKGNILLLIEIISVFFLVLCFALMYFHDSTQGTYQLLDYRQGTYYKALALQFEKGRLGMDTFLGGDWLSYKGNYYLYFGPLPPLLWLFLKHAGITVTFSALTLFFSVLNLILFYILLFFITKDVNIDQRKSLPFKLVSFILYSFGPLYFTAARYFIYETAIVIGSTLLLFTILAFYPYWTNRVRSLIKQSVLLFLSGCLLAFVFLTRLNLILIILPIIGCIIYREYVLSKDTISVKMFRTWFFISLVMIPIMLAAWAMTTYNTARFGHPLEFGIKYSIIGNDHSAVAERVMKNQMTHPIYLALNTVQLIILRPFWTNVSPHLIYNNRPAWLIGKYPKLVDNEYMSSLFFSSPLLLFMVYAFYSLNKHKKIRFTVIMITGFLVASYLYGGLSMAYARRYIQDYYAFLILLTCIGWYYFWQDVIIKKNKLIQSAAILVVIILVLCTGILAVNLNCQAAFTLDIKRCLRFNNPVSTFKPLSMIENVIQS